MPSPRTAPQHGPARLRTGPSSLRELLASREMLANLTWREVRTQYRFTALGQGWSLLNPVVQIAIYTVVFSYVLQINPPPATHQDLDVFALWLSAALLPWLYFNRVVMSGVGSLVGNANLIKKVYFPREALVIASALSVLATFLIELVVLHVAVVVLGGRVHPLLVPTTLLLAALLGLFGLGIGLVMSTLNVYFRDTQHLLQLFFQAWAYATPLFYPIRLIEERLGSDSLLFRLYRLNPMERFVEAFRDTVYNGQQPAGGTMLIIVGYTAAALVVGHLLFARLEGRLAEEL